MIPVQCMYYSNDDFVGLFIVFDCVITNSFLVVGRWWACKLIHPHSLASPIG